MRRVAGVQAQGSQGVAGGLSVREAASRARRQRVTRRRHAVRPQGGGVRPRGARRMYGEHVRH